MQQNQENSDKQVQQLTARQQSWQMMKFTHRYFLHPPE